MTHAQFLQQAIDLAVANVRLGGGPYGAIVVRDGKVIASSGNRVTEQRDPTAHAEVMAIRLACQFLNDFKLSNCILYSSCEPCPMCIGAIYWARIRQVFYAASRFDAASAGFDDSFIYEELDKPVAQRSIAMQQLDLENTRMPFVTWQATLNKMEY